MNIKTMNFLTGIMFFIFCSALHDISADTAKPNFVLINIDDMGWTDVGYIEKGYYKPTFYL